MLRGATAAAQARHAGRRCKAVARRRWTGGPSSPTASAAEVNDAVDRFNGAGAQLVRQMQQVAAQFAGQDAGAPTSPARGSRRSARSARTRSPKCSARCAARASRAWTSGSKMPRRSSTPGSAKPRRGSACRRSASRASTRSVGRQLAQAQLDYQDKTSAYNALMVKSAQRAYEVFEEQAGRARSEPGRQLTVGAGDVRPVDRRGRRGLCRDRAVAGFRKVYGGLVNAQMRVRAGVQQRSRADERPARHADAHRNRRRAPQDRRSSSAQLRRLRDAAQAPQPAATGRAATCAQPRAARTQPTSRRPKAPRRDKTARQQGRAAEEAATAKTTAEGRKGKRA